MIPKVGNYYHFWDDGKTGPSRHYICKCERIVSVKEAKSIMVPENNFALYDIWEVEASRYYWLYKDETDYFIECSCPTYDKNNLWFARTKHGGWFSMNIQSWWQSGRLDVTGEIYEEVLNDWELNNGWIPYELYPEANEDAYASKDNFE